MINRENVLKALSNVIDPDLQKDLVTLHMIEDLEINDDRITFSLVLTTPACPLKDQIKQACLNAISHLVSKDAKVSINLTSRVTSQRKDPDVLKGVKNIIAVASGKGGVGKSTIAGNLALSLKEAGAAVGLLDADMYGPSIPTLFGINRPPEMLQENGRQLIQPLEKSGIKLLSIGFLLQPGQAVAWRGPMISSALRQFLHDVAWGELDYLIIDLPPGTGDIHLTLAQQFPITGAVIVTTPQEVALADARKAVSMFNMQGVAVPLLGVVENMSYFVPDDMPKKKYYIFGQGGGKILADETQIPLLGQIPLVQEIRENADSGNLEKAQPAIYNEAFRTFAQNVAQAVAIKNAGMGEKSA